MVESEHEMRPILVSGADAVFLPLGIEGALRAELAEAVGPKDSSTIGCGLGRFEACAFPWRLTYDECLFVVSGEMEVISQGRAYRAGVGDSLFLPKGIEVEYRFREPCQVFYATYPVNWAATRQKDLDV